MPVDPNQLMAGEGLLDMRVHGSGPCPLVDEVRLGALGDEHRHEERERHGEDGDDGEQRTYPDHHGEHADDGKDGGHELGEGLLEGRGDIVDVVRDPAEEVSARRGVVVLQRQPAELVIDFLPKPEHRALGNAGHDRVLRPGEQCAHEVDDGNERDDPCQLTEVDTVAGVQGHGPDHLGLTIVARCLEPGDRLLLGHAARDPGGDDASENHVRRIAEELRSEYGEEHAHAAEDEHGTDEPAFGMQSLGESANGTAEIGRLLRRRTHRHPMRPHRTATRRTPTYRPPRAHHAHTALPISAWDRAISR